MNLFLASVKGFNSLNLFKSEIIASMVSKAINIYKKQQ